MNPLTGQDHAVRLVVLISGGGTNLQAILDACGQSASPAPLPINARVVAVFSNRPEAFGLARAESAGVPAIAFPKTAGFDRLAYDKELADRVAGFNPDWIVLAGWMRLLNSVFLSRFPNQVINLHPALPGTFPGTHAIERALLAYQQGQIAETGVMVHVVPDEGVDDGPVLAQQAVPIYPLDTLPGLEERVHVAEHRLLVDVLYRLTQKKES